MRDRRLRQAHRSDEVADSLGIHAPACSHRVVTCLMGGSSEPGLHSRIAGCSQQWGDAMAGSNFLERFRPLGAPGAATAAAGTPTDESGPATELIPVFAALAGTVEECRTMVERATLEAERELVNARERANAIVAQARIDVGEEQARAAAGVLQSSSVRDTEILRAAESEAARVTIAGEAQIASLARDVVERLLADLLLADPVAEP